MIGKAGRTFSLLILAAHFLASYFLVLPDRTDAKGHFWDELGIVRFNERIKAPTFTLKDLDGREVTLEDHRGKIVFLNFWATWCPPCRREMPSMEKLHREFKDRGFTMLAVDLREEHSKVKAFKGKLKLSFPILLDPDGTVGLMYAVRSLPTTYLIDREGYMVGGALGARNWASKEAFELFDHLTSP